MTDFTTWPEMYPGWEYGTPGKKRHNWPKGERTQYAVIDNGMVQLNDIRFGAVSQHTAAPDILVEMFRDEAMTDMINHKQGAGGDDFDNQPYGMKGTAASMYVAHSDPLIGFPTGTVGGEAGFREDRPQGQMVPGGKTYIRLSFVHWTEGAPHGVFLETTIANDTRNGGFEPIGVESELEVLIGGQRYVPAS